LTAQFSFNPVFSNNDVVFKVTILCFLSCLGALIFAFIYAMHFVVLQMDSAISSKITGTYTF